MNVVNCLQKFFKGYRSKMRLENTVEHYPSGLEEKECYQGPMTTVPLKLMVLKQRYFAGNQGPTLTEAAGDQEPKSPPVVCHCQSQAPIECKAHSAVATPGNRPA